MAKKHRKPEEVILKGVNLREILKAHSIWTKNYREGQQAAIIDCEDLNFIDFSNYNLDSIVFHNTNLSGSTFANSNLLNSRFTLSTLNQTNFSNTELSNSILSLVKGNKINLSYANLTRSQLDHGEFTNSLFSYSHLYRADFFKSDLSGSNFTGSTFIHVTTFNWKITNVICDYLYVKLGHKSRYPKNRNFELGEFERLFREVPTIEIIFERGFDLKDHMAALFLGNYMKEKGSNIDLQILSVDQQGIYPRAKYQIESSIDKDKALEEAQKFIEYLRNDNEFLKKALMESIKNPRINIQGEHIAIGGASIHDESSHTAITINIQEAVIEIEKAIKTADEEVFKKTGTSKKGILDALKNVGKEVGKETLKDACKDLLKTGILKLTETLPTIAANLPVILGNMGM